MKCEPCWPNSTKITVDVTTMKGDDKAVCLRHRAEGPSAQSTVELDGGCLQSYKLW